MKWILDIEWIEIHQAKYRISFLSRAIYIKNGIEWVYIYIYIYIGRSFHIPKEQTTNTMQQTLINNTHFNVHK